MWLEIVYRFIHVLPEVMNTGNKLTIGELVGFVTSCFIWLKHLFQITSLGSQYHAVILKHVLKSIYKLTVTGNTNCSKTEIVQLSICVK